MMAVLKESRKLLISVNINELNFYIKSYFRLDYEVTLKI